MPILRGARHAEEETQRTHGNYGHGAKETRRGGNCKRDLHESDIPSIPPYRGDTATRKEIEIKRLSRHRRRPLWGSSN